MNLFISLNGILSTVKELLRLYALTQNTTTFILWNKDRKPKGGHLNDLKRAF